MEFCLNFLEFKNFNDFKIKTGMQGKEAIMFLVDEIAKKECTLAYQKRGKNDAL